MLSFILNAQKLDPRSVALVGATTTIADGIYSVGYNPALLAYQVDRPFMLQLGGLDFGIGNNYLSLAGLQALNGDTLNGDEKTFILNRLENYGGLTFNINGQLAVPGLNFSTGNMAITSNIMYFTSYVFPAGIARLFLEGNAYNPVIDMEFNYEIMAVNETAFSFAVPFESFALGVSLKSLQGLFYMGIDQDLSSASFVTTPTAVSGSGTYFIKSGVGGSGFGLDVGIATKEYKGMRFGLSMINALGVIKWNQPSFLKDILSGKDSEYGTSDDVWNLKWAGVPLTDKNAGLLTYKINDLRADNLSSTNILEQTNSVVPMLDKNGNPIPFNIRYPAIFRAGGSYKTNELILSSDLTTGFENRLYANSRWRWAVGAELIKFSTLPLRMGFAWEGLDKTELGIGVGFHGGPVMVDVGFAFKNGIWVHSMKGLSLSLGFTMTGFKGRKSKVDESPGTPSPVPEELLPNEN